MAAYTFGQRLLTQTQVFEAANEMLVAWRGEKPVGTATALELEDEEVAFLAGFKSGLAWGMQSMVDKHRARGIEPHPTQ